MNRKNWTWAIIFSVVLLWSAIGPKDYLTWLLEVFPALIGASVMLATRRSFPLTLLTAVLILLHCIILMVGGHYTYAEVPLLRLAGGNNGQCTSLTIFRKTLIKLLVSDVGDAFFIAQSISISEKPSFGHLLKDQSNSTTG